VEIGNALLREKGLSGERVIGLLAQLRLLTGEPIRVLPEELAVAASLADRHRLSLYDAAYWAVAQARDAELITTDSELLAAGAGQTPADYCEQVGLEPE
jgi:predicted nucleic acid-binding protein